MAIYIDAAQVPDMDNIDSRVFAYLIKKHKRMLPRFRKLMEYYRGYHDILRALPDDDENKVRFNVNYAKYVVDVGQGYYLGEPVKYNCDTKAKSLTDEGIQATVKNGRVQIYEPDLSRETDISRVQEVYENETISEIDSKIGKYIGIYGEAYELLYANSDDNPEPRSAVVSPENCIMVRDNTVEHRKLFAIVYEEQEDINESRYFAVTVYTDHGSRDYKTTDLQSFEFFPVEGSETEHFFGEVPVVEYQNNDERQGDFEQIIPMQDALNELMSDRVTDKKKFVNSILAMYGMSLADNDNALETLRKERFIDGLPLDGKVEYINKAMDESSVTVLCNDIIREIHKMTLTVDMTDQNFAGNSSGQALMLKLMTMNMLVKNKMRSLEKGLKKRFEMYNRWLSIKGEMSIVDKKDVDVVFIVSMPIDKTSIVDMIVKLQGLVDDKTLLSQLWFIKDVDEVLEAVKEQKAEAQKQYLDTFARQREEDMNTSLNGGRGTQEGAEDAQEDAEDIEGNKGIQKDDDSEKGAQKGINEEDTEEDEKEEDDENKTKPGSGKKSGRMTRKTR